MSTKIGGFENNPVRVSTGRPVKRADDSASSSQTSVAEQSAVDTPLVDSKITDTARTLAALDKLVQEMPAVDQSKVERIQSRIANGSYKVDAERIADRLLQTERALKPVK